MAAEVNIELRTFNVEQSRLGVQRSTLHVGEGINWCI